MSVRDWSWRQTRRRFKTLGGSSPPYKGRAILSVLTLLLSTAIALAPPLLAKTALNDAINGGSQLYLIVALFLARRAPNWGMTYAQTYLTGWVGRADAGRPARRSSSSTSSGCRSASTSGTAPAS